MQNIYYNSRMQVIYYNSRMQVILTISYSPVIVTTKSSQYQNYGNGAWGKTHCWQLGPRDVERRDKGHDWAQHSHVSACAVVRHTAAGKGRRSGASHAPLSSMFLRNLTLQNAYVMERD